MMRRKLLRSDDPNTVWSLINLAGVLNNRGRMEEADELTREAQSIKVKLSARPSADPKWRHETKHRPDNSELSRCVGDARRVFR